MSRQLIKKAKYVITFVFMFYFLISSFMVSATEEHTHNFIAQTPIASECSAVDALEYGKCECGKYQVGEEILDELPVPNGHNWEEREPIKSLCSSASDIEYSECSFCHKYLTVGNNIVSSLGPVPGHISLTIIYDNQQHWWRCFSCGEPYGHTAHEGDPCMCGWRTVVEGWYLESDGLRYAFPNGDFAQNQWLYFDDRWYYFDDSTYAVRGWKKIDGKYYYFDFVSVMQTGWIKDKGVWYYLDSSGVMLTGWQKIGNDWYYFNIDGSMHIGWLTYNNVTYYMGESGNMQTGWIKDKGVWYYLDSSGAMLTGWQIISDNWYYLNKNGSMHIGWLTDNNIKYYMDENGAMHIGWAVIDGQKYMFDGDGKMIEGAQSFIIDISKWQGEIDWDVVSTTIVDGVIVRTSHGDATTERNGVWKDILFEENISELNRIKIPYGLYHYNTATSVEQARLQARAVVEYVKTTDANPQMPFFIDIEQDGGKCDLIAITKVYIEEFIKNGYKPGIYANLNYWTNYINDPEFDLYYKWVANYGANNGTARPSFSSKEKLQEYMMWQYTSVGRVEGITENRVDCNIMFSWHNKADGWKEYNSNWYFYSNGYIVSGWKTIGGNWYYFGTNGVMKTGWQKVGNAWYYFAESGVMVNGWQKIGGIWYHFNTSGAMQIGWKQINGAWYYFDGSGAMQTDWQKIDNTWYYFADSGVMLNNWQKIGGVWYYFNTSGAMQIGWKQINGAWYYFDRSGAMQTDWQKIDNTWYYFAESGVMLNNWQKIDGAWYYFNASGAMQTGWHLINNVWYYMHSNGVMASNCYIDGYWLTSSGAMA